MKKYECLLDIKDINEAFILKKWLIRSTRDRLVRWTGKRYVPEGCCNTWYVLEDLDTGEIIEAMAESWIVRKTS